MSMLETFSSDFYEDGRTKQSFKDDTDINKLLRRAAKGDTITHLAKNGATYGDFSDIDDLLTAQARLKRGQRIFDELPAEVKREFDQDVGKFYNFVNDANNIDRLGELLPGLSASGNQLPNLTRTPANQGVTPQTPETPQPPAEPPAGPPAE